MSTPVKQKTNTTSPKPRTGTPQKNNGKDASTKNSRAGSRSPKSMSRASQNKSPNARTPSPSKSTKTSKNDESSFESKSNLGEQVIPEHPISENQEENNLPAAENIIEEQPELEEPLVRKFNLIFFSNG
jgi:hypothetical protein